MMGRELALRKGILFWIAGVECFQGKQIIVLISLGNRALFPEPTQEKVRNI
jgi:hypothetical protein